MNKKISTGTGIAVIAVVALVFAVGTWKVARRLDKPQRSVESTQNSSIKKGNQSQSKPIAKNEVQVGWKKYSNTKYGFELQYPNNWLLEEEDMNGGDPRVHAISVSFASPETRKKAEAIGEFPNNDLIITAYLSVADTAGSFESKNLLDYLNQLRNQSVISKFKKTTINAISAYETNQMGMGSGEYTLYMESGKGKIYEMLFPLFSSRSDLGVNENAILNSFKQLN